jgi:predicted peptidase
MKLKFNFTVIVISLITFLILTTGYGDNSAEAKGITGSIVKISIPSPSLQDNLLKDPISQTTYIYLPPSYNDLQKNYPVVYFLHGFDESPSEISLFKSSLNSLMEKNK